MKIHLPVKPFSMYNTLKQRYFVRFKRKMEQKYTCTAQDITENFSKSVDILLSPTGKKYFKKDIAEAPFYNLVEGNLMVRLIKQEYDSKQRLSPTVKVVYKQYQKMLENRVQQKYYASTHADAEDLTQDALVSFVQNIYKGKLVDICPNMPAYLLSIVDNKVLDTL
jgi:hypothetical protein